MPGVALTFDDGPGPSTMALLDVLATFGVKATFFLLGQNALERPDLVVRLVREGHSLGNHSFSHPRHTETTAVQFVREVLRTDRAIHEILENHGIPGSRLSLVRLPFGNFYENDPRVEALTSLGRPHVHWTADFGDWNDPPAGQLSSNMQSHIIAQYARGLDAVLLLHDSSDQRDDRSATVEAVRLLLEDSDYQFFTLT